MGYLHLHRVIVQLSLSCSRPLCFIWELGPKLKYVGDISLMNVNFCDPEADTRKVLDIHPI